MKWIAAGISFFLAAPISAQADSPLLLPVSTVYKDSVNQKQKRIAGTGIPVEINGKYYILTVAHLADGEDIRVGEQPAKIHIANSDTDLALLESAMEIQPFLRWRNDCSCFRADKEKVQNQINMQPDRALYIGPVNGQGMHWQFTPEWQSPLDESKHFGAWHGLGYDNDSLPAYSTKRTGEIVSNIQIKGGLSGSPLLDNDILAGIAKRYSHFFTSSEFVDRRAIKDLVKNIGSSGHTSPTRFRFRNGMLYKDYSQNTREIDFRHSPAGNGTSSDGGNGTSSDGGNGTSSDGGNGTSSDGGNLNCGKRREFIFEDCNIHSHALYFGKPVLGFVIREQEKSKPLVLNAEASTFEFILGKNKPFSIERISPEENLWEIFQKRMGSHSTSFVFPSQEVYSNQQQVIATAKIEFKNDKIQIRIFMRDAQKTSLDDEIFVTLDKQGKVAGDTEYRPILSLKSKAGKNYQLQINDLFFSSLQNEAQNSSDDGWRLPSLRLQSTSPSSIFQFSHPEINATAQNEYLPLESKENFPNLTQSAH